MKKVGITGGMGSGKSLICRVLHTFSVPVFYADDEVKKLYNNDAVLRQKLIAIFGTNIYKDNTLQATVLAQKVFGNTEALVQLNNLVHPVLQLHFEAWAATQQNSTYVVEEAALLCESGIYKKMDITINVVAPKEIRTDRVLRRNPNMTAAEIERRMAQQWNDEQRGQYAQFTIVNDNKVALLPQILQLHEKLMLDCFVVSRRNVPLGQCHSVKKYT